jgi:hypothetical protein
VGDVSLQRNRPFSGGQLAENPSTRAKQISAQVMTILTPGEDVKFIVIACEVSSAQYSEVAAFGFSFYLLNIVHSSDASAYLDG